MSPAAFSRCRSCGAPITWRRSQAGERIPIVASRDTGEPTHFPDDGGAGRIQSGAVVQSLGGMFEISDTELVVTLGKGAEADPNKPIWRTHFWDCPDADEWRKKNQ